MAKIFCYFIKNNVADMIGYLSTHDSIIAALVDGYDTEDVALSCGQMLRECIKVPTLHEILLVGKDGAISKPMRDLFEKYVQVPAFEVSVDAFETLTMLLTSNKALVLSIFNPDIKTNGNFLRYSELFDLYNKKLVLSENYVLKRQSLKLLSEFLLDRENFRIMMQYISDKSNLKIIMTVLRHKLPNIQYEAFHVFKVFVANPEKPDDIANILAANKGKLISFLDSFPHYNDDEQFIEEKQMLVDTLNRLPDLTPTPSGGS
jgi:calcium binding protein 39